MLKLYYHKENLNAYKRYEQLPDYDVKQEEGIVFLPIYMTPLL